MKVLRSPQSPMGRKVFRAGTVGTFAGAAFAGLTAASEDNSSNSRIAQVSPRSAARSIAHAAFCAPPSATPRQNSFRTSLTLWSAHADSGWNLDPLFPALKGPHLDLSFWRSSASPFFNSLRDARRTCEFQIASIEFKVAIGPASRLV